MLTEFVVDIKIGSAVVFDILVLANCIECRGVAYVSTMVEMR